MLGFSGRRASGVVLCLVAGLEVRALAQGTGSSNPVGVSASTATNPPGSGLGTDARQLSELLGLQPLLAKVKQMQAERSCSAVAAPEEIATRETLVEAFQAAMLETDSVLAGLGDEQSELTEMRAELQSRRDKTVARLNTAALLTGSGLGAAVSATQFTTLSSRTQNTGDALGVGSGAASTILSLLAAKKQGGPSGTLQNKPRMLAPLLSEPGADRGEYPASVMSYLNAVPDSGQEGGQTRLEQLRAEWAKAGRLPPKEGRTMATPATSNDPGLKVSITDLSNRIAMLGDVRGRVALMNRSLAALRRMSLEPAECAQ